MKLENPEKLDESLNIIYISSPSNIAQVFKNSTFWSEKYKIFTTDDMIRFFNNYEDCWAIKAYRGDLKMIREASFFEKKIKVKY